MEAGDVAWILASTALVMLMIPGVGFFYAGMVRKKNVISMITLSIVSAIIVGALWTVYGYSLAFSGDVGGFVGDLSKAFLSGVSIGGDGIPEMLFMIYQMMFAAVTLAIITSAIAERMRFSAFLIFGVLWVTLVYIPFAHWLWGGGWLAKLGALDFAGGIVVHVSSGFGALALAFVLGKRYGYGEHPIEPHNIPLTLIGGAMLWFGWFGFNGGSALAANEIAVNAITVTFVASSFAGLTWMAISWLKGKPGSLGVITGVIAGLATITPAAGFVDVRAAIVIGIIAGALCFTALEFRIRKGIDESLDAWAVHGVGGAFGSLAIGLFANPSIGGYAGLLYGNPSLLTIQLIAVAVTIAYSFAVTFAIAKVVDAVTPLRVSLEEEYVGLDIPQHGEVGYA
ncbi:ammonium transporter [Geoglobus ahangari]|uniref:Ammonium transporter n=1 Tax=Geoglobus ahangari TaxID=113653 RepID=A0A0F7IE46_9EURY|nr:ammonium transporter [Geoglobus ahangari]AKG90954.1 ammonium transporter [Geoglobus ahangari]